MLLGMSSLVREVTQIEMAVAQQGRLDAALWTAKLQRLGDLSQEAIETLERMMEDPDTRG